MHQQPESPLVSDDGRDVTTILDADATIRYVSPSIEPILGYKPEQLVGQNWFQYVHPDDAARALPGFGQTSQQPGTVQRNALRVRHANGSWVKVEEVGSNLLHYPGVHGWILNARNMGAPVGAGAMASAIKEDDTKAGVAAGGNGIARDIDPAERVSRWYTQLLATLSHELRTPLNVIIGYHDLLLDGTFGALSSEQSYTLRRAHRSARELLDIVTATLDLSRMDGGRMRLAMQTVAAQDLFTDMQREMQELCDKPGIVLEWNLAADAPRVTTDPSRLKMIVKHLLRNALQLTDHGTITISVQPGSSGLEVGVRHSGAAIPNEAVTALISHQEQSDAPTLERFGGSGLALYTAQRMAEVLGGTIGVENDAPTGSIVRLHLPTGPAPQRRGRNVA